MLVSRDSRLLAHLTASLECYFAALVPRDLRFLSHHTASVEGYCAAPAITPGSPPVEISQSACYLQHFLPVIGYEVVVRHSRTRLGGCRPPPPPRVVWGAAVSSNREDVEGGSPPGIRPGVGGRSGLEGWVLEKSRKPISGPTH